MAIQGLKPEQIPAAQQMVDRDVQAALDYYQKPQDYPTMEAAKKAQAEIEANPFNDRVREIVEASKSSTNPKFVEDSIAELKRGANKAMEDGKEPKGIGSALNDAISNFTANFDFGDIGGSIWGGITQGIKIIALSVGGEWLAPQLKSLKSQVAGLFGGQTQSVDEATNELHAENASAALAEYLGKTPEETQAFADTVAGRIQGVENKAKVDEYLAMADADKNGKLNQNEIESLRQALSDKGVKLDGDKAAFNTQLANLGVQLEQGAETGR